jgi:hypothetical protein
LGFFKIEFAAVIDRRYRGDGAALKRRAILFSSEFEFHRELPRRAAEGV